MTTKDRTAYLKAYREAHRDEQKLYCANHREQIRAREAAYYRAHAAKINVQARARNDSHREQISIRNRIYRMNHLTEARARAKVWKVLHREANNLYSALRRARTRGLQDSLTLPQWDAIKVAYGYKCAYCGKKTKLTQDHVIPIVKGGGTTADNIVPACSSCNSHKGTSAPDTIPAVRLFL